MIETKNKDGKTSLHIYLGMLFKTFIFCKKKIVFALLFLMEIVNRGWRGQNFTKESTIRKGFRRVGSKLKGITSEFFNFVYAYRTGFLKGLK